MSELNKEGKLKGKAKMEVFKRGCRETSKNYHVVGTPALPKVVLMKKQHVGESMDKFKTRRKACNKRRREKESICKLYKL